MLKCFCDRCEKLLGDQKFTMQVLKPTGDKMPNRHYCTSCWSIMAKALSDAQSIETPKIEEDKVIEQITQELTGSVTTATQNFIERLNTETDKADSTQLDSTDEDNGEEYEAEDIDEESSVSYYFNDIGDYEKLDGRTKSQQLIRTLAYIYTHPNDPDIIVSRVTKTNYGTLMNWRKRFFSSRRQSTINDHKNVLFHGKSVNIKNLLNLVATGWSNEDVANELNIKEDFVHYVKCYYTGIVVGHDDFVSFHMKAEKELTLE